MVLLFTIIRLPGTITNGAEIKAIKQCRRPMNHDANNPNVQRVKSIRKRLHLQQWELADKIGIGRCYLSELETGRKKMQQWVVDKVIQIEAEMSSKRTQAEPVILSEDNPNWPRPKSLKEHRIQQLKQWAWAIENFESDEQTEALCEIRRIVQALLEKTPTAPVDMDRI